MRTRLSPALAAFLALPLAAVAAPEGPPFFDAERSLDQQDEDAAAAKNVAATGSAKQVLRLLVDSSPRNRDRTFDALVKRNSAELHEELAKQLGHKDEFIAAGVAELFGRTRYAAGREALEKKGLRAKSELAALEAVWALERIADPASAPALEKAFKKKHAASDYRVQGDALIALAKVSPETARALIPEALTHKNPPLRIAGLVALGRLSRTEAAAAAVDLVRAEPFAKRERTWEPRVLAAALEAFDRWYARQGKTELAKSAIGALIARMAREDGAQRYLIALALSDLTGEPVNLDPEGWQTWWAAREAAFAPQSKKKDSTNVTGADGAAGSDTTRVRFHGIPIYSKRVLFAQDVSGGMKNPMDRDTSGSPTKMAFSSGELQRVLAALPDDALCNVVFFATAYEFAAEGLLPIKRTRIKLKRFVEQKSVTPEEYAMGRSNLYDTLHAGLLDPEIDTMFFLSEGGPTTGRFIWTGRFFRHLNRLNLYRRVRVHALQVATGEFGQKFLEQLARDTGGTYYSLEFLRKAGGGG